MPPPSMKGEVMMRKFALLFGSLVCLASNANAAPLPNRQSQPGEILVVGQRNPGDAARDFVQALALPSADKQLARFYEPVCPYVAGLRDSSDELVVQRMRKVAAAVGMKVAKEPCKANALLFVVRDKAKLLASWRKSDSPLLGDDMSDGQIMDLIHSAAAATSWQLLDYRGSDGRTMVRNRIARIGVKGEPLQVGISPDNALENDWAPVSRIMNPVQIGLGASVLVDAHVAGGADLRQLADFASMQLFAKTRPQARAGQPAPTILTLLDDATTGRPAPLSVTEWDLAYLKALYSYADRYSAGAERGDLARRMSHYISSDAPERK
jgi:hypothetical protein